MTAIASGWTNTLRIVRRLAVLFACASPLLGCTGMQASLVVEDRPPGEIEGVLFPPQPKMAVSALLPPAASCVLFDGDGNLDDVRAMAVLSPHRRVAGIVATAGIVSAPTAAATMAQFVRGLKETVVIQGRDRSADSAAPPAWAWLAQTRANAERLTGLLSAVAQPPLAVLVPDEAALGAVVARTLADCSSIGLVITGPWSSFIAYYPAISAKIKFVIVQGRSPVDPDDPEWDRVNCSFDRLACMKAVAELRLTPVFWIDLPAAGPPYPITQDLATALSDGGLAGKLKRLMQQDGQWRDQQIWDDGAAMFLVDPARFKLVGRHIEPDLSPPAMLLYEAKLMNGITVKK